MDVVTCPMYVEFIPQYLPAAVGVSVGGGEGPAGPVRPIIQLTCGDIAIGQSLLDSG